MTRSKKSRLEKNSQKIIFLPTCKDEKGTFFNYCSYGFHIGIIGSEKLKEKQCLINNNGNPCKHYHRYSEE
jgi:hypothetical protein